MKVREIMTKDVKTCGPETNLAAAALLLKSIDAGVLPVVVDGELRGIITDRDIALAVGEDGKLPAAISVGDVMSKHVHSCKLADDVHSALKLMRSARVRRLPVVDKDGELSGIVSLNDLVLSALPGAKKSEISYEDIVATMKAICEHTHVNRKVNAKAGGIGLT